MFDDGVDPMLSLESILAIVQELITGTNVQVSIPETMGGSQDCSSVNNDSAAKVFPALTIQALALKANVHSKADHPRPLFNR